MKLALAIRRYPPFVGGAEHQFRMIANALAERGHEAHVLTGEGDSRPADGAEGPAILHRLYDPGLRVGGTALFLMRLCKTLRHLDPQVAMASQLNETSYTSLWQARRHGAATIVRISNVGWYGNLQWTRRHWCGGVFRRVLRNADRVVVQADFFRPELEAAGCRPERIRTIPNAVAIPALDTVPARSGAAPLSIAWVGRLTDQKNPFLLLAILGLLRQRGVSPHLHVFGEGELAGALAREFEDNAAADSVTMHGAVDRVAPRLGTCHVLLNTSRSEGLSNAILEAMAAGLPVVATSVGGTPELLRDGETGFLFPEGGDAAAADALQQLAGREDLRKAMGENARARAQAEFSPERIAAQYEALFEEVLSERR